MKAREVIEAVVAELQRGGWSTEHIKAAMTWGHGITLHVTNITTDDPKQALSEAADLAEQIGDYIRTAREKGYWHALSRLQFKAVGHPLGQSVIDQIKDELVDMGILGTQSSGGFQVIAPFKRKAKSTKSTKYTMGYKGPGPRWKSAHSAPGHTNFGYNPYP